MNKRILTPYTAATLAVLTFCSLPVNGQAEKVVPMPDAKPVITAPETELETLSKANSLREERLKAELAETRAKIERLKLENELLTEQQALEDTKREAAKKAEDVVAEEAKAKIDREAAIAKSQAALAA